MNNYQIFSDFSQSDSIEYFEQQYRIGEYSLEEFGFQYEANFINFDKFYAESGGIWNVEGGLDQVITELQESEPGDRIQILTHPVWWGK